MSNFFERLKVQASEKERADAAAAEALAQAAIQKAAQQIREADMAKHTQLNAIAEEARKKELRVQAMQSSLVPKMMMQMGEIIKGNSYLFEDKMSLLISDEEWKEGVSLIRRMIKWIRAQGNEDGSVSIGTIVLNQQEAKSTTDIETVLEFAYSHPEVETFTYLDPNHEKMSESEQIDRYT